MEVRAQWASLLAQIIKNLPELQETQVRSLGWEEPLEKGMATPFQYSCLENPMDRGASVHGVAELDPSELLTLSLFFFFFPTKAQFHKTAPSLPTSFSPYIHISDTNGKSKLSPVRLTAWL